MQSGRKEGPRESFPIDDPAGSYWGRAKGLEELWSQSPVGPEAPDRHTQRWKRNTALLRLQLVDDEKLLYISRSLCFFPLIRWQGAQAGGKSSTC